MSKKKNNRKRTTGWAKTKSYPHERHPATYRRKGVGSDDIEYITFTHSAEVDFDNKKVKTIKTRYTDSWISISNSILKCLLNMNFCASLLPSKYVTLGIERLACCNR